MSDHEFEKKVQQKMDELRLRPSDAVWAEVEKNLRREKRRRRTLIWLPILGVLLTAGGYLIYSGTGQPNDGSLAKNQATEKPVAPAAAVAPGKTDAPVSASSTPSSASITEKNNQPLSSNSTPSDKNEKAGKNNSKKGRVIINNDNDQPITKKDRNTKKVDNNNITIQKEPAQKVIVTAKDSVKTQVDSNAIVQVDLKFANPSGIDRSYASIKDIDEPELNLDAFKKPAAPKKYPVPTKKMAMGCNCRRRCFQCERRKPV